MIYDIVVKTLMVSPAGAFSPGPLTVATMAIGANGGWRRGFMVALGHMLFELPYVGALAITLSTIEVFLKSFVGDIVTLIGVAIVLFFAYLTIKSAIAEDVQHNRRTADGGGFRNPVLVGILFTGFNIYFLLWWISIGFTLIVSAVSLGVVGFTVMYLSHVWMDFLWLSLVAEASKRGLAIGGGRVYRLMMFIFGLLLIFFSINIVTSRFLSISIVP